MGKLKQKTQKPLHASVHSDSLCRSNTALQMICKVQSLEAVNAGRREHKGELCSTESSAASLPAPRRALGELNHRRRGEEGRGSGGAGDNSTSNVVIRLYRFLYLHFC